MDDIFAHSLQISLSTSNVTPLIVHLQYRYQGDTWFDAVCLKGFGIVDYSAEYVLLEYQAREHWDRREYTFALEKAGVAAATALGSGDTTAYARMVLLLAECQLELGMIQEFATSAKNLSEHPALQAHPVMVARAKAVHSRALQSLGHVGEALALAQEAADMEFPEGPPGPEEIERFHALLAALAESGHLDEAWKHAQQMSQIITSRTDEQVAGKAYWAIGNVAFLLGKVKEGAYYHSLAAEGLSPTNDVNLWALFNKSSAHMRLDAGLVEPATLECIERAEMAMSVSGVSPMDELETSLTRAHWLLVSNEAEEAVLRLTTILEQKDLMPPYAAAEAQYILALALHKLGLPNEARENAGKAEQVFIGHGAGRRANHARELIDIIDGLNR